MAVAASPHAAEGDGKAGSGRRAPFLTGPSLVRIGAAAALVIVLRSRQQANVRNARERASAPTPSTTEASSRAEALRHVAVLVAAAAVFKLRRAPLMLRLLLLLLPLLLYICIQARKERKQRQRLLTIHRAQADGEPAMSVSRCGKTTKVSASVAVASSSRQLWSIVRDCLNGDSGACPRFGQFAVAHRFLCTRHPFSQSACCAM